jgi:hypothetical protein
MDNTDTEVATVVEIASDDGSTSGSSNLGKRGWEGIDIAVAEGV